MLKRETLANNTITHLRDFIGVDLMSGLSGSWAWFLSSDTAKKNDACHPIFSSKLILENAFKNSLTFKVVLDTIA